MITLNITEGEDGVFKNPEDAIKYMFETNFESDITVYDINADDAYKKTQPIYDAIKAYNEGKPLDDQILPSNPYGFRGILGCLGVQAYSISGGTYARNREVLSLFTGYNQSVLDTSKEKSDVRPGLKALSSMALMAQMMFHGGNDDAKN